MGKLIIPEEEFKVNGQNYWRYFFFTLLTIIILISTLVVFKVGTFMIVVVFGALAGILSINFPSILVFKDSFVVKKVSLLIKTNNVKEYKYEITSELNFAEGKTNRINLILQTLSGMGAFGGFTEPDKIIIHFNNGVREFVFRIGSRKNFKQAFEIISRSIHQTKSPLDC